MLAYVLEAAHLIIPWILWDMQKDLKKNPHLAQQFKLISSRFRDNNNSNRINNNRFYNLCPHKTLLMTKSRCLSRNQTTLKLRIIIRSLIPWLLGHRILIIIITRSLSCKNQAQPSLKPNKTQSTKTFSIIKILSKPSRSNPSTTILIRMMFCKWKTKTKQWLLTSLSNPSRSTIWSLVSTLTQQSLL